MSRNQIVVHRTYDPIQAEMLGDLLRDAGLAAQVIGTRSGAAIGAGQVIMQLYIQVPEEQAGQAIDFLEDYFESDGAALLREQGVLEEDAEPEEASTAEPEPLRPLLAAGSVLLMFGGSHLYARRNTTTLMIAAGQILAILNMMGGTWRAYITGVTMFSLLLVFDLIGGQLAVRAHNRGQRPSRFSQLMVGAAFVAAAGTIGTLLSSRIPEPKRRSAITTGAVSNVLPARPVALA